MSTINTSEGIGHIDWSVYSVAEVEQLLLARGWQPLGAKGAELEEGRLILQSPDGSIIFRMKSGDIEYERHIETCANNPDNPHFQEVYKFGHLASGEHYTFMEALEPLPLKVHQTFIAYVYQEYEGFKDPPMPELYDAMYNNVDWNYALHLVQQDIDDMNAEYSHGKAMPALPKRNLAMRVNQDGSYDIVLLDPTAFHDNERLAEWDDQKYDKRVNKRIYHNPEVLHDFTK